MTKSKIIVDPERLVFAMDIGTRSIVGLVCYPENGKLRVLAVEVAYHPQRDMLDGQIHNVEGVIKTAQKVKAALEKKLGLNLKTVALAAAGRALKTRRSLVEKELEPGRRIKKDDVASAELEAVEQAREALLKEIELEGKTEAGGSFYCVGHSTVAYYLDDFPINSLVGQKGKKMKVEVLVTFLPQVVIDSLLTVVEELGLSVSNLTLEPIAAINVTIPPEYRSLNLALVDVGAGTSDIAITHKGAVIAYAMVPLAGDEITEQIAETFLLDFNAAEKVKLMLTDKQQEISFQDILGNSYKTTGEEILKVIEPAVDKIAAEIAAAIEENNNGPPRAVFCIGGGSQTPFLREKLAEKLHLPLKMVSIRGSEIVEQVIYRGKKFKGPEFITPLGIAVSALKKDYFGFTYVTVNGKIIRLLEKDNLKISNALVAASFPSRKLLGRRGPSLRLYLDGKEKIFPGTPGENARILLNGEEASLDTPIKNNDKIDIIEAKEGQAPLVKLKDLFPPEKYYIYLNNQRYLLYPRILVNNRQGEAETILKDKDSVEFQGMGTLKDFLKLAEIDTEGAICLVNDKPSPPHAELHPGDKITVKFKAETEDTPKELSDVQKTTASPLKISVNGREIILDGKKMPVFVDIFNYIDFDRSKPQGKLVMIKNGLPASLTEKLADGDEISIYWEK